MPETTAELRTPELLVKAGPRGTVRVDVRDDRGDFHRGEALTPGDTLTVTGQDGRGVRVVNESGSPPSLMDAAVRPLAPAPDRLPPAVRLRLAREAQGLPVVTRKAPLGWRVRNGLKNLLDGSYLVPLYARVARRLGLAVMYGELRGRVLHADGTATDYGLLGRRVVTTAGVAYVASAFDNTVEPETLKYAGFGTGTTAESTGDTGLVTELTTQYASANTRPTGSQAHSTNTYTTVATLTPSADVAITEHGVFSSATSGAGTLWDRTKFSAINLVAANPDSLQATYALTLPSGG